MPADPPPAPAAVMQALASSLSMLEHLRAHGSEPRLHRLLARRRLALLLMRRAMALPQPAPRDTDVPMTQAEDVVAGEWRLARMVASLAETLPQDHPARSVLTEIRSEIEEAALTLRLILHTRQTGRARDDRGTHR